MLNPAQQQRYARHLVLPGFGAEAQERLLNASVLMVGAGGLGSPIALYLAAAGVGRIGIVDDDVVDLSNLQRQVIHRTADEGTDKVDSARRAITDCNPDVAVEAHRHRFDESNARSLVRGYDLVIDGADNFPTRYLINDAAVLEGRPVVHGSIYHFEGQATVFFPPRGPCYRCLYPDPPAPGTVPSCAEGGVLGVLPGLIGMVQATEAVKLLAGLGESLIGRVLTYDALSMAFRALKVRRHPACPLCGESPTITEAKLIDFACDPIGGGEGDIARMSVAEYLALRSRGEAHLLIDVRESHEVAAGSIEGHVHIPLGEVETRTDEIAAWRDRLVVCQCQRGQRSLMAAGLLRERGFTRLANLEGGYLAWVKAMRQ